MPIGPRCRPRPPRRRRRRRRRARSGPRRRPARPSAASAVVVVQPRRVPVHVAEERLLAVVGHLDRLAGVHREHAGVHVHRQVLAAAEGAADAGEREPHLLGRQAEARHICCWSTCSHWVDDVEVDAAVLGRHREAGLGAEEGLVLHADLVLAGDDDVRLRASRPDVALAHLEVPDQVAVRSQHRRLAAELHDRRRLRVQRLGGTPVAVAERGPGVGDRLQHVVVDDDPGRCPARGLGVVGGHERHRLALVEHDILREHGLVGELQPVAQLARHVVGGQHGVDARDSERPADVERADAGVRVRAAQRDAPQHVVHPEVAAVGELAGDLQRAVGSRRVGRRRRRRCRGGCRRQVVEVVVDVVVTRRPSRAACGRRSRRRGRRRPRRR